MCENNGMLIRCNSTVMKRIKQNVNNIDSYGYTNSNSYGVTER